MFGGLRAFIDAHLMLAWFAVSAFAAMIAVLMLLAGCSTGFAVIFIGVIAQDAHEALRRVQVHELLLNPLTPLQYTHNGDGCRVEAPH